MVSQAILHFHPKQRAAQRQVPPHKPAPGKRVEAKGCPTQRNSEVSGQRGPLTCKGELSRTKFLPLNVQANICIRQNSSTISLRLAGTYARIELLITTFLGT